MSARIEIDISFVHSKIKMLKYLNMASNMF